MKNASNVFWVIILIIGVLTGILTVVKVASIDHPQELPKDVMGVESATKEETFSCGPGVNSGDYVSLKSEAECQNYTDCGFNDGSWKLMKKEDCTIAQKQETSSNQNRGSTNIDCVGPDGKHLRITQKECDDFNKAWGRTTSYGENNAQNNQNSTQTQPLVTCVLSFGTYQLTQSTCDLFKQNDIQISSDNNYLEGLDKIGNTTFQITPINTNIAVPTSPQIITPTPKCTTIGWNTQICNPW